MKIFLTGAKSVGKSTVLKKVLKQFKGEYDGFFTKKQDMRIDFNNLADETLFSFNFDDDPDEIAKKFDIYGVEQLLDAYDSDLIVMDELGFLERKAEKFKMAVMNIMKSDRNVLDK